MKMMKVISIVLAMSMLVLTGCSTFNGTTQPLIVNVSPSHAKFRVDGQTYTGSQTVEVWRRPQIVGASAEGYNQDSVNIGTKMSDLAKIDIFIGLFLFWPNLLGLVHPGARELKRNSVTLNLTPLSGHAKQYAVEEAPASMDDLQRAQYRLNQKINEQRKKEAEYQRWVNQQGVTID